MSAVAVCPQCEGFVYVLQGPAKQEVRLDPVDHPDGEWVPQPDGRTARPPGPGDVAHREHDCLRGQEALFAP